MQKICRGKISRQMFTVGCTRHFKTESIFVEPKYVEQTFECSSCEGKSVSRKMEGPSLWSQNKDMFNFFCCLKIVGCIE